MMLGTRQAQTHQMQDDPPGKSWWSRSAMPVVVLLLQHTSSVHLGSF